MPVAALGECMRNTLPSAIKTILFAIVLCFETRMYNRNLPKFVVLVATMVRIHCPHWGKLLPRRSWLDVEGSAPESSASF